MTNSKDELENALWKVLADRTDDVVKIAFATRKAVLKSAKGCSEFLGEVYCVINLFSYTGKHGQAFIHIATYANHVNLGFNYGTQLEDPENLLEGTGKLIRHIRINSDSQLRTKGVKNLIDAAVAHAQQLAESKGGLQAARIGIRLKDKSTKKKPSVKKKPSAAKKPSRIKKLGTNKKRVTKKKSDKRN